MYFRKINYIIRKENVRNNVKKNKNSGRTLVWSDVPYVFSYENTLLDFFFNKLSPIFYRNQFL
jgi:hypothetical protein